MISRVCGAKQTTVGNTRYSESGVEAHLYHLTPNDTAGAALLVPGRTAVLIHCKSRLFQPANPNTASMNGTRWTAGVVLQLFASSSTEAFLKTHLEQAEAWKQGFKQTRGSDAAQETQQVLVWCVLMCVFVCAADCQSMLVWNNIELKFPR